MSISRPKAKTKFRLNTIAFPSATVVISVIALVSVPVTGSVVLGQVPDLSGLNWQRFDRVLPTFNTTGVTTGEVRLDGRELFAIAAPAVADNKKQQTSTTPIEQRVQGIENILNRILASDFDPQKLKVVSTLDDRSGLPIISINDQYLMTVTTLDAQLQGHEPQRWANELTELISSALIRAKQERQPEFLVRQGVVGGGILVGMLAGSWGISLWQRRLQTRKQAIDAQFPTDSEITPELGDTAALSATVQQQMKKRQRRNLNDIQRRILQLGQVGLWSGGSFVILGLFPHTRWLQTVLLSAPLKLIGLGLGIYIVIRFSDIFIDRFLSVLEDGKLIAPAVSQRLTLRVSTFSRVLKSISAIIWIGAGAFTALSMIGVEIFPVVAGAGIIGLAISFASQSLIKDMINGFLILLEDQYAVGDVIAIGNAAGLVEYMNLRITQLRNAEGRLITIPNGTITVVENLSKDWSRVDLAIDIAYSTDVNQAITVITQVAQEMSHDPDWQDKILETPEVLGVDKIDQAGITIRVWIKTQPLQQWSVAREFRRRLKVALDERGVSIGIPQQSVWFRSSIDAIAKDLEGGKAGQKLQQVGDRSGKTEPNQNTADGTVANHTSPR